MKKLILLLLSMTTIFVANAQNPSFQIHNNVGAGPGAGTCTGDLYVVVYAVDYNTSCSTTVGKSNPIALPASGTTSLVMDYSYITSNGGWSTDPGAYASGTNEWAFDMVEVKNCGSVSTATTSCGTGNGNAVTLNACNQNDCFKYTTSCTNCSVGQEIDCSFTAAGPGGTSVLITLKL